MRKKSIKQTILNFHEEEGKPLRFEDSLIYNGDLLEYALGEIVTIENRTVCGPRRYSVSKIESFVASRSLLILEPKNEKLRRYFPKEIIFRKVYDLFPVED